MLEPSEEKPIIFFDSHPQAAPGYISEAITRFTNHLSTAWTGVPIWDVSLGQLRLAWTTVRFPLGASISSQSY